MTKVCAMATNAKTTPLFETEVKTLVDRPFACWDANRMNITANTRKLRSGPALRFQNRDHERDREWTRMGSRMDANESGAEVVGGGATAGEDTRPASDGSLGGDPFKSWFSLRFSEVVMRLCSFRSGPLSSRINLPP